MNDLFMTIVKKTTLLFFLSLLIPVTTLWGQYVNTKVKTKHEAYKDSLKQVEYDYIFPILGQGAYKKGFDIPYPAGLMANFMWLQQNLVFDNMQLGVKTDNVDIPLTPVDFIEFGENINTSYAYNVRPDLWVLPFLNVYGIFGGGQSNTEVNIIAPISLLSIVDQDLRTAGVGVMGAGGIGPIWFSVDANWTWSKPELLDKPVQVNVLGIRFGHTFTFKEKPERNFALWAGAMSMKMSSETSGEIKLIDALPPEAWERKDEIVTDYYDWYENEATPPQKIVADQVLTPIVERIDAADGSTIIRYGMDKQVEQQWNGTIGGQFQLNKRWMFRSEAGLIGNRKSFLVSINYRFLL
ncbi:hypothetical protein QWY87_15680 [Lutimonas halocynthiae]|uniref:hypothetical protein n=1 Tax=Lutimonas halocynthiae TaxID=1446477 RepID=UPI0025B5E774|nr:hypothetical protein [Lutimonas halocynthiae]MDN3644154.1 hypothetical protein [Lutimonas halocynthiae]